jgi:hypothetical protein
VTVSELTPDQLTAEIVAIIRDRSYVHSGEHPIWRWQRWIKENPERAWHVFQRIVQEAPDDSDVLESVAFNLQLILCKRWEEFFPRAVALVRSSPLLEVIVGPELLTREYYGPRYRDLDELAWVWVRQHRHSDASRRLSEIIRTDPGQGLDLALEIIERGPLHGLETEELHDPFRELVQYHGAAVVDRVEAAARRSAALRQALWDMRRLNASPSSLAAVPADLWDRLMRAAGDTTLYNTPRPKGRRRSLGAELDELVDRWFIWKECFWAWCEVNDLVHEDAAKAWLAIQTLVRHAPDEETLGSIGAGPLEDLIRLHPLKFIQPIEKLAQRVERFRFALGCVWLKLEGAPENLVRRYWNASGRELRVVDAPFGWEKGE